MILSDVVEETENKLLVGSRFEAVFSTLIDSQCLAVHLSTVVETQLRVGYALH